jgi:hypothetical protein
MKDEHNKAAEHHESAAKSHRAAADSHGKNDHAKGKEHSTQAQQHSQNARDSSKTAHEKSQPLKLCIPLHILPSASQTLSVSSARLPQIAQWAAPPSWFQCSAHWSAHLGYSASA